MLTLPLVAAPSAAQDLRGNPSDSAAESAASGAEKELERKALGLLEETVSAAGGLRLEENRIRVQVTAAGLLWTRDAEVARAHFKHAADGIAALIAGADPADPQSHNDRHTILQLRSQLIHEAAAHDARLALDFLRATRQPPPFAYPDAGYRQPDPELALELSLAAQVVAQDPKQALRMAEESLSRGVSQGLMNVFHQLVGKDRDAAARLATGIVRKLRAEDLVRDYEASNVAIQLFALTRAETLLNPGAAPPDAVAEFSGNGMAVRFAADRSVTLDEQARKQLVETLVAAALTDAPAHQTGSIHNILNALRNSLAEVERYVLPARAASLKRQAVEFENRHDPHGRFRREHRELLERGSIEALIEAAPKAPPEVRDQLYTNAAWKALGENNLERARQIAGGIANPDLRAQMLRDMERQFRMRAAEQGNIYEARQMAALIPNVEERVSALIHLCSVAQNRGDKSAARELLEEARAAVGRGESASQFYSLFDIARAYSQLDEERAFEVIEGAIDRLNELVAAAVVVDGFGQDAFREGELKQQGGYMWNDMISRCAQELAALAPKNFERARSLAQRFQRTDTRTTAQLLLTQNILQRFTPKNGRIQNLPLSRRIVKRGG